MLLRCKRILSNIFLVCAGFFVLSCDDLGEGTIPVTRVLSDQVLNDLRSSEDHTSYYVLDVAGGSGTLKSTGNNIVLTTTGGPDFSLYLAYFKEYYDQSNYVMVSVKQEQHRTTYAHSTVFSDEERDMINAKSIAILNAVATYYKERGNKVSLFGHSFGAFILASLVEEYGTDLYEKVIIGAGRLNMHATVWKGFDMGHGYSFQDDGITLVDLGLVTDEKVCQLYKENRP